MKSSVSIFGIGSFLKEEFDLEQKHLCVLNHFYIQPVNVGTLLELSIDDFSKISIERTKNTQFIPIPVAIQQNRKKWTRNLT